MGKLHEKVLFVSEIFESISGEVGGSLQGDQVTFVRFAGCNLRCGYCDAAETQVKHQDQLMTLVKIFRKVALLENKKVVITGGEPFLQSMDSLIIFVEVLTQSGYQVSIETNGTFRVPFSILKVATIVMDYKLNFINKMKKEHFLDLKPTDFVKFVIDNNISMAIAVEIQGKLTEIGCSARFAYSPSLPDQSEVSPAVLLAELKEKTKVILKGFKDNRRPCLLNIQIHKLIDQP